MIPKIYIDGQEGTTGLQIYDRLGSRKDLELLLIDESKRKDVNERRKLINAADIVFLCLPDAAAIEAVSLIDHKNIRVIDASTAHRTNSNWVYGFPEMSDEQRGKVKTAKRVANPGCHATGFVSIAYPLIKMGILPMDCPLTCFSLTGYSGGGKKMIAAYETEKTPDMYAPRLYGLNLLHKHLPEMVAISGMKRAPVFCPIVDDYYKGMATTVTLYNDALWGSPTPQEIRERLATYYTGEHFITVAPFTDSGLLESNWGVGTNNLEITVCGNDDQTMITSRFDNLGKGASGAAVQNMNIMLGLPEETGLE